MNRTAVRWISAVAVTAVTGVGAMGANAALKRNGPFEISTPGAHNADCSSEPCLQQLAIRVYAPRPGMLPTTGYTITINGKVLRAKPSARVCYNDAENKYCTLQVVATRKVFELRSEDLVTGFVRFKHAKTGKRVSFKVSFKFAATRR